MSSAIEVLKELLERNLESAEYQKAVEEALLALEQKEKLRAWVEREICAGRIKQTRAQTQGENIRQTISMTRLKVLREILGELK